MSTITTRSRRAPIRPGRRHRPTGELYGLLAEYDTPGELVEAARKVRDAGYTDFDCYTRSRSTASTRRWASSGRSCRWSSSAAASPARSAACCSSGTATRTRGAGTSRASRPGRSPRTSRSRSSCTILLAVLTSFFGMWMLNKLPQVWHPLFRIDRFARVTDDGVLPRHRGAATSRFDAEKTTTLLEDAGAIAIEHVHLDPDPEQEGDAEVDHWRSSSRAPRSRWSRSRSPRRRATRTRASRTSTSSRTWTSSRSSSPTPRWTCSPTAARTAARSPARSRAAGSRTTTCSTAASRRRRRRRVDDRAVPTTLRRTARTFVVDTKLLERGQNRFNIYCTPCHGYDGRGQAWCPTRVAARRRCLAGAQPRRAPRGAASSQMPNGQLFNTISNGFNTMMGYAAQIPRRGSLGDRRLRPRARARAERVAR